jgi:hypothetical protein
MACSQSINHFDEQKAEATCQAACAQQPRTTQPFQLSFMLATPTSGTMLSSRTAPKTCRHFVYGPIMPIMHSPCPSQHFLPNPHVVSQTVIPLLSSCAAHCPPFSHFTPSCINNHRTFPNTDRVATTTLSGLYNISMCMVNLDVDKVPCHMCAEPDDSSMLMCEGCNAAVHMSCIGLTTVPASDYYCEHCGETTIPAAPRVCVCHDSVQPG